MTTGIFSSSIRPVLVVATIVTASVSATAESRPGYYSDPDTGIVYRQVTRSVERPVVETKMETKEQTVFRPETVKETRPESHTIYTPVTEYHWQPQLQGRWNPFRQPTIAYKQVPKTHWQARNQVVNRTETRTQWVPETRTIEVPHRIVRMEREHKVEYEAVGRVAPQQSNPNTASEAIASRLQPLAANTPVQPIGMGNLPATSFGTVYPPNTAQIASTLGRMTSDPPRRSIGQSGMRTTELYPSVPSGYGLPLPPASNGMVTIPGFSLWR